ncbi:hypothetical protein [Streptomyces sp.]|uniref:hypothetical protein n=1 Tax=Streptomyces sp. TaxID=1931 RepID=UPI002F95B693
MPPNDKQKLQELQLAGAYIASHPRFSEVVDEIGSDPAKFETANVNPVQFLNGKGFDFPPEWNITMSNAHSFSIAACVNDHCISITVTIQ